MSIQTTFDLFTATAVSTAASPFVHTLTRAESVPALHYGYTQAYLYYRIANLANSPSLVMTPANALLGSFLNLGNVSAALTTTAVLAYGLGITHSTNQGDYLTGNDSNGPLHAFARFTWVISGASATADLSAKLIWIKDFVN